MKASLCWFDNKERIRVSLGSMKKFFVLEFSAVC
jgi:hypothetical protein